MLINFPCPECKTELEVDTRLSGTQSACPQCGKSLVVPRREPGPGVTIGQFQIRKFLSKGGMGEVFLARQLSLGRDVALKILPAHLRGHATRVQRFLKEVQTLARLDHPNIVMAHEAGEDGGILYLAMSYVPGDSLEQRLADNGPMPEAEALKLVDKLAGALDYAWREHHLLHRDIKPANVLFTAAGEVKLTDFGLAKCLDDATELTMSGDIIGSPNYMSPEQVNNCLGLDCRSDMYSLGATLYHMLTGKLPFAGSSLMETLKKQISEALPDPRVEHPGISEASIILLEIMLAKDRNDRHPDYPALRADVARVIAGERPTKTALNPGESVLLRLIAGRTPRRSDPPPVVYRPLSKPPPEKNNVRTLQRIAGVILGLAIIILLAAMVARETLRKAKRAAAAAGYPAVAAATSAPAAPVSGFVPPAGDDTNRKLRDKFQQALKYARDHPDDFAGARDQLEFLRAESKGTEWEWKIAHGVERLERFRRMAIHKGVQSLTADVQALLAKSDFEGAFKRIESDPGIVAEGTKLARENLIREVTTRKQAAEEEEARRKAALSGEGAARQALQNLLRLAGVSGDLFSAPALTDIIRSREYSPDAVAKIKAALEDFNKNYSRTETAREYAPVISALGRVGDYTPPPQRNLKSRWRRSDQAPVR